MTAGTVASPLRREAHGGFGERLGETDREQSRHRAPGLLTDTIGSVGLYEHLGLVDPGNLRESRGNRAFAERVGVGDVGGIERRRPLHSGPGRGAEVDRGRGVQPGPEWR